MKKIILIIFLLKAVNIYCQTYHSEFEKSFFKNDTITDYFKGLLVIDSLVSNESAQEFKKQISTIVKSLPPKESKDKKEIKRVKKVYNIIHDTFLMKYNLESHFSDIFKTGYYNCVTATALYSYIFEQINIPYKIKELPTHIFLIAYPETYKIYLETTVPGESAYIIPNDSKIKSIVDELISYKLATKSEVFQKGYKKFYEDYYFTKDYINKESLIGIQYYNQGIFYLQSEKEMDATNSFVKAKKYYESPVMDSFLKSVVKKRLYKSKFDTKEDISFLIEVLQDENNTNDFNEDYIKSLLFELVKYNSNEHIKELTTQFKNLSNKKHRDIVLEYVFEYLARNEALDENHKQALEYCDEILAINNKSKIAKEIIEYFTFKEIFFSTYNQDDLKNLQTQTEKYPFLKQARKYSICLVHLYANISFNHYVNKNSIDGETFRKKLEAVIDGKNILEDINKSLISNLYQRAGNYYYYKDKYKTAYAIYKKGISYLPNDTVLIKKMKWSKEEF